MDAASTHKAKEELEAKCEQEHLAIKQAQKEKMEQALKLEEEQLAITTAEKELEVKRQLLKHWQRIAGEVKDMEEEGDGDVPRVQLQS